MSFKIKTLFFVLAILCLVWPNNLVVNASAITYYVSPTGNDSNPGTQTKPFLTISKAAKLATVGSTILVGAGKYNERVNVTVSGAINAPITYQASGSVVILGFTVSANYITINGFEITNKALDNSDWGVYVTGSNDVIENNYIHDTTWGGVMIFATVANPTLSTNDNVEHNKIYHVGQVGVDVRGRNNLVQYNDISAVMQRPSWLSNPPSWVDADGIHFHGQGHILRGNYIHGISYTQPENVNPHIDCFQTFYSAPSQEAASKILIQGNRCDNAQVQTTGEQGKGFTLQAASYLTIQNNLISAATDINASSGTSGLSILNNDLMSVTTLATPNNLAAIALTNVPNVVIKNNIFYNNPSQIIYVNSGSAPTTAKNLVYRSDTKQLWSTNTYSHSNDLWGINPLFISPTGIATGNYQVRAGSPAIDAGVNDGLTIDFNGSVRPQGKGFDIGAYEMP